MEYITQYQALYFAHWLTRRLPSDDLGKLTASLQDARVDLTPHQIEAALFAFKSPLSKGAILADEVGLGKTIEAGIILSQHWAEHKRRLLIIAPANLRKQWAAELQEKFYLPVRILESKNFDRYLDDSESLNPFDCEEIVVVSYQFAKTKAAYLRRTAWDLVIIDEAHRLRNVYKPSNKIANILKRALEERKKVLLTATPLQNSILELYGLTSIIDDYAFGDLKSFKMQYSGNLSEADYESLRSRLAPICKRTLRRQVLEYIRYTKRIAILQEFFPTEQEQQLYDLVSEYLQRPKLYAMPNSQRQLMTMILRKLLASSTYAIYGTLCSLIAKLERKLRINGALPAADTTPDPIASDFDSYDEERDEWLTDDDDAGEEEEEPLTPYDIEAIRSEIADLERFRDLAFQIKRNSKAEQLFDGLNQGFARLEELGAPKKALLFTESRRTQDFLFELLEKRGYRGKVMLFNGTNADSRSNAIYRTWKKRHEGTSRVTGSATADKRAALVDYFRDEATIMIATEAAAEGINLQFCSLVVNYDMPWNPQRIEQRIGRCHRYGQKHDVVVINFLNKANAADVRVYQLLDEKFQLFSGVFGASDEVLGAIGNGVDFEKRIALIYNQCRTQQEIKAAFDELQLELQEEISDKMLKARSSLLENFDEEVKQKLRDNLAESQASLDRFEQVLWSLTRYALRDFALFSPTDYSFDLTALTDARASTAAPGSYAAHFLKRFGTAIGRYYLKTTRPDSLRQLPLDATPYRINSPLAKDVVGWHLRHAPKGASEVVFDYSHTSVHASLIEPLIGTGGWLTVEKLSIESFENEDTLLIACFDEQGNRIFDDVAAKMLLLNATEQKSPGSLLPPGSVVKRLDDEILAQRTRIIADNAERNRSFFDDEMEKLDLWADDVKAGLEKELRDLDAEIKLRKGEAKRLSQLDEKVRAQRLIKELEKKRSEKRMNLFQAQDDVDARKEELLEKVEAMLAQKVVQTKLFTIRWRVV